MFSNPIFLVIIAVCFSATGELFLKEGMNRVGELSISTISSTIPMMIRTWPLYAGFGSIGIGAIFWLAAISRVDLSLAYPMLASGYILVMIFSALFLSEHISMIRWTGATLIVVGVYLISRS